MCFVFTIKMEIGLFSELKHLNDIAQINIAIMSHSCWVMMTYIYIEREGIILLVITYNA